MNDEATTPPSQPPPRNPRRLTQRRHDVLIIGGGINGAGLARDLALRGLDVVLAEKGDFASGTSSASTKLVHGGVRYLEQFAFHLVFEACRERKILQTIAPHLVRPIPFFIPVYRGDPRPLWMIRAGMALYDLVALFRNTHRHRILSPARALAQEPALQQKGLTGVALYWDCRMDDARLCLENVLAAREAGAEVVNYLEATGLLLAGGRIRGARLMDLETGEDLEIEAAVVVNAAGPWLDRVCALAGEQEAKLRPTRGTHILVPRLNRGQEALYLTAGRDDRLFFVIPWGDLSLIGTTDVDYPGDPDAVEPTGEDVDYLLAEAQRHLRLPPLDREKVVAAFAGLRPLVRDDETASQISREHRIFESGAGLISVGGGKYTTYRAVAAEVAEKVTDRLGKGKGRSRTDRRPLPGGDVGDLARYLQQRGPEMTGRYGLPPATVERLVHLYGSRTSHLCALLDEKPELARPVAEGSDLLAVQVVYAARWELARTPEDVLRRRVPQALRRGRGLPELAAVTEILAEQLGADSQRREQWRQAYLERYAHILQGKDSAWNSRYEKSIR